MEKDKGGEETEEDRRRKGSVLSCQTAIQAIKVIFFTIITRITSLRDEFGLSEIFP